MSMRSVGRKLLPTHMTDVHWPPGYLRPVTTEALFYPRLILLCVLALVFIPAGAAEDLAVQTKKLQQLQKHINGIKTELASMHGQRNTVQAELEKTEKKIGRVTAGLHRLDADADIAHQKMQSLNKDRTTESHTLASLRKTLSRDLQSAYTAGRQQRIKLLLNQQDPAQVGRMMTYHGFFTRARANRLQELRTTLARIDGIEHALVEQQAEIKQLQLQQQEESARLTTEQNNRHKILVQLQRDLQVKKTELSTLQEDELRLQALVQSLQQAMREISPQSGNFTSLRQLKGKLRWPVAGRLTRRYGSKQSSEGLQSRGVLISSRAGADVHAIAAGQIVFADWLRGFGLLLIVDHGHGYMSLYGQNRSLYKDVGAWVKRDEVVAAAGSSGGRDQDGLYLELRKDGRPFNPTAWFDGRPLPQRAGR
ncbi:MAG: peptidoglycan DD-metalloendopeptidase family protein [Pseudomonadota bacterium]